MKATLRLVLFLSIASVTFNQAAHAGLLLEPYVGYVSGTAKGETSTDYTGSSLGARVGFTMLGFGIGADYEANTIVDDGSPKSDFTRGEAGLFLAYKFPILFRLYATYVPTSSIYVKQSGTTTTLEKGTATKIGLGYTGFPFININLEFNSAEYKEAKGLGTLTPKVTTSGYALSISAPFDLF